MNEQEQRIREFAYEIWQTEGCPDGQGERHWEMARKLVEAQQSGLPMSLPLNKPRKSTTKPTDVSAASSAEQSSPEQSGVEPAALAKPAKAKSARTATAAKGNAKPKPAATEAAEGTPAGVKKTRTPRAKKDV